MDALVRIPRRLRSARALRALRDASKIRRRIRIGRHAVDLPAAGPALAWIAAQRGHAPHALVRRPCLLRTRGSRAELGEGSPALTVALGGTARARDDERRNGEQDGGEPRSKHPRWMSTPGGAAQAPADPSSQGTARRDATVRHRRGTGGRPADGSRGAVRQRFVT